jgi:general secretion pathway protein G
MLREFLHTAGLFFKRIFKEDKGWTFVETRIVIAIALMRTTMVGLTAFKQVGRARRVKAQTEIENASLALTTYYLDCGIYPSEEQGLKALSEEPSSSPQPEGWSGPYLSRLITTDPWGREYIYSVPGQGGHPFGIISYGADGMEGGEDEEQDIKSW